MGDGAAAPRPIDVALRRVRLFNAALLFIHFVGYNPPEGTVGAWLGPFVSASLLAGALLIANLLSHVAERGSERTANTLRTIELSVDVAVAVLLAGVFEVFGERLAWVLLVVPVLEAALRHRLTGAVVVWSIVSAFYLAFGMMDVVGVAGIESDVGLARMQTLIHRLAVILLVVLPIAYLSEQLLVDIGVQQRMTATATRRGEMLATVARIGRTVTRLGTDVADALVDGAVRLGFDGADVCRVHADGIDVLARAGTHRLGAPNRAALTAAVRAAEPVRATNSSGALLCSLVAGDEDAATVLRAGSRSREPSQEEIEGLALLTAQAAIAVGNTDLVGQLERARADIEHQALHDSLTGLPNRAAFGTALTDRLAEPGTAGRTALLFIDLDHFKPVNDRYGHEVGDQLLVAAAERMRGTVRGGDMVARLGGDEFCVLCTVEGPQDADRLAERICTSLVVPFRLGDITATVSTSVGIAESAPGISEEEMLRRADIAMYQAKEDGRAKFRRYDPAQDDAGAQLVKAT